MTASEELATRLTALRNRKKDVNTGLKILKERIEERKAAIRGLRYDLSALVKQQGELKTEKKTLNETINGLQVEFAKVA